MALDTALVALYTSSGFGFPNPFEGGESFGKGKAILVMAGSSIIGLGGTTFSVRLTDFKHFNSFTFRDSLLLLLLQRRNMNRLSQSLAQPTL